MYTIKLTDFEGPLDLLLFFIKRDELDIYDIPIAKITKEFLDYVHFMESLDLEVAGEFLVMAAELMQVKVRMLLPPEPGEEEEEDPRANLVKRLVEYKRFKEMAGELSTLEEEQRKIYSRGYRESDPKIMTEADDEHLLRDVSLFDLISSFRFAMDRMPKKFTHEVIWLNVTVDEQIAFLKDLFSHRSEITFGELMATMEEKIRIVVTFLALLDMIRSKDLIVRQNDPFGDLSIMRSVA
ncbi:MAG TPA: segregation/condensation protein A [Bacteroidota bacterium]|nr:segregation/condensation protein A [Bacteroidota bacterium]